VQLVHSLRSCLLPYFMAVATIDAEVQTAASCEFIWTRKLCGWLQAPLAWTAQVHLKWTLLFRCRALSTMNLLPSLWRVAIIG